MTHPPLPHSPKRLCGTFCRLLALILPLLLRPLPLDAVEGDPPVESRQMTASVTLDDIIVEAEREGYHETDTSLNRIEREDVTALLSKSVSGALERDPSIFRFRNARGEQSITMRGFDQRQLLVLMDGVPLYNAYDRVLDLGKIPMGPVSHITLVKGAGSVAYGPNGLGGAINITTRRPGEGPLFEGEFASSPEDEAYRFRLGSDVKINALAYHLDFGGVIEDGYHLSDRFDPTPNEDGGRRENSDTESYHLSGKMAWDLSASHRLQAGGFVLKGDWGVSPNVFSTNPRYWRWSLWEDVNGHVGHAGRYGAFSMEETLYVNLNNTVLDSFDDDSYTTQETPRAFHSRHEDATVGATLRPALRMDRFPLIGGEAVARAWVGARYDRHEERPAADEPETAFSVYTLTVAPEVELEPWDKVALIAGLQADLEIPATIEGFDPDDTSHVGPLFQVFCRPEQDLFLKFQATRRARFPTLKERYSSTLRGRIPNPNLRPEKAWNLGLDTGFQRGPLRVTAGTFYSDVTDLIQQFVQPGGEEQIQNAGSVRHLGAEALLEWTLGRGFLLRADYAFLHFERDDQEDRLSYLPAHKGSVSLGYARREWLDASTMVRAVSAQYFQDPDTGRWGRLGAYAVWDAYLQLRPLRNLSVWMNVENLLDADYQNAYGFPEPGRTFWVGLRAHVD